MTSQSLTIAEQKFLLQIARKALEKHLREKTKLWPELSGFSGNRLKQKQGCFVTLHKFGKLRGCIGHILPIQPLYLAVVENAIAAGFKDPRFEPVAKDELADIEIEISALSLPQKLVFSSTSDLLAKLIPLKHGVILKKGEYQATFLPQVWENLKEKENFLNLLSQKAGLSSFAWQEADIEIYTYEALIFCEKIFIK